MTTLILQQKWNAFSLSQKLDSMSSMLQLWMDRHHQRKQLAELDNHQLADLGLNTQMVNQEVSKPFWK